MKQLGRFVSVALAGVLCACSGDSTGSGGPSAASVTGIAGDNQSGPTGSALAFPLSLVALDGSGQPVQGVQVSWSVSPGGAASFSPATDTTDVNGSSSTNVTLGGTVGNITLTAAVHGAPNVVYHATAVDPCNYLAPYTFGQTVNGTLTAADCHRSLGISATFYYDFYALTVAAGQQNIRVSMHGSFDGWLDFWLGSGTGDYTAFDDDSILGEQQNPQLDIILAGGPYIVGASSFDPFATGTYSLSVTSRTAAMNGCRQVWVMRGVTVTDSVTATDCADSSATPHYYDVARIIAFAPTVLSIAERSSTINPSLAVYKVAPDSGYARHLVASNDDSSTTTTNAFIKLSVDTSNVYDIIISTSAAGQTGTYTFSVDTTTTLSPHRSLPTGRPGWWQVRPGELLQPPPRLRGTKL
ncbi:MAG TPA: hypothetical protein VH439_09340 [Gemmatimonadales bacterium]